MIQSALPIEVPELMEAVAVPGNSSEIRVRKPVRNQVEMVLRDLDSVIGADHPVRAIWGFLSRLDLEAFYGSIRAVLGKPGRPASDPQVLLALWIYGTAEGVGSARRLARLSEEHDAYRWLRGGVPVDYHLLAEFRVVHQKEMDDLMTQIIAVLMKKDLVQLKRVSQDGLRVRASAGGGSFHRERTLRQCLAEAQEQLKRVAEEREHPDSGGSRREKAARERAAREREERVAEALRELPKIQEIKERQKKRAGKKRVARMGEARVSTTDPIARNMKMPDGGFRPAYNMQFATDTGSQVIVGVAATNQGTDQGQALGMEEQVEQRTGKRPDDYLIDGGFIDLNDIAVLEGKGVTVYAPPRDNVKRVVSYGYGAAASKEVAAWRERMQTEPAKTVYKERAATSECVNAQMRSRHGLNQFTVRGLSRVLCVTLLAALTHNLLRWISLTGVAA